MQNKANLPDARMKVTCFTTSSYVYYSALRLWQNKAKQSQYKDSSQESECRIHPLGIQSTGCLTAMAEDGLVLAAILSTLYKNRGPRHQVYSSTWFFGGLALADILFIGSGFLAICSMRLGWDKELLFLPLILSTMA